MCFDLVSLFVNEWLMYPTMCFPAFRLGFLTMALRFVAFLLHIHVDARRSSMIRRRAPGPYEDITGPTVLGIVLMLSILAQFSIKLYHVMH